MTRLPNIVYILADDMGYGDLSCLNEQSRIRTANLDRLAAEGMAFTDAHASSAVCTPSRYSILTGRYNWRSSLKSSVLGGYGPPLIEPGRMTAASYLKSQGYATACFGKWHLGLGWVRPDGRPVAAADSDLADWSSIPAIDYAQPLRGGPVDHGFDSYFGISASLDMPPYAYIENDRVTVFPTAHCPGESDPKRFHRPGPMAPGFRHEEVTPELTRRVCAYLRERVASSQPYFVYFPLPSPHTPILPASFAGRSGTNAYGDFCLMVDWAVGEVMRTLEETGAADDTIVIFTSDNGCSPQAGFAELAACGHHPSYIFRGHKADIYEGGHRVPLLVRWPRTIAPGGVCAEPVGLTDLLATCAEFCGAPLPDHAGEDSVSNLALWRGDALDRPLHEALVHHSIDGSFAIRQGRWKLEFCPGSGGWSSPRPGSPDEAGLPPRQLYALDDDAGERRNRIDEQPETAARLTRLMTDYLRRGRSTPGVPQSNTGPRYWPQLNWLTEAEL